MRRGLVLSVALVPALASAQAPDADGSGEPPPESGAAPEERPRPLPPPPPPIEPWTHEVYDMWNEPVFLAGAAVFAASYGASIGIAATSNHSGASRLYVPLIGPWLAWADWTSCSVTVCSNEFEDKALLIGDGVLQAAGVLAMIGSFIFPAHRLVNTYAAHVRPMRGGLLVFGRF